MMIQTRRFAAAVLLGAIVAPALRADDVSYVEENGVKYQVTRQVVQRQIPETRYEQREYTTHSERYTTDMQEVQRTYLAPITEQQWVPGYQRTWNVFAPPVLSYRLMPVTRWENRTETVRIPSTRRELIPQRITQQVPVTTTRLAQETHEHRVPVGVSTSGSSGGVPSMASRLDSGSSDDSSSDSTRDRSSDQIDRRR